MAYDDGSDAGSVFPLSLGLDQPPVYGAAPAPVAAPQAPRTPPQAGSGNYSTLLQTLAARMNQPQKPVYSPDEIAQRKADNATQYQLGILGQLSGDAALSDVGGLVFKQALAQRTPTISEKGVADPLTGEFTPNAAYLDEKNQALWEKAAQASAGADQQAALAQEREQNRLEMAQQANATRAMMHQGNTLMQGLAQGRLEDQMQNTFLRETKPMNEEGLAADRVLNIIQSAASTGRQLTAQEQSSLIDQAQRSMNPGAIVRNSQYDRVIQSQGLLTNLQRSLAKWGGKGPLAPEMVAQIGQLAAYTKQAAQDQLDARATNYIQTANRRGLDPAAVVGQDVYGRISAKGAKPAPGAAPSQAAPAGAAPALPQGYSFE